jgi:predicted transposase YdaD
MRAEATARKPHPFWDRSIRALLQRPSHLKALVKLSSPDLAERLDFERLERIERTFIVEDYRQREADIVLRVPYRSEAGERIVMVFVLVEHQSAVDVWMPFRLLLYMLLLWDDLRRRDGTERFQLPPIVPVVFYTGAERWDTSLNFRDLIEGAVELRRFAPQFDVLYVGLPETPASNLEAVGPVGWTLRALQRVSADHPEFAAIVGRAVAAIRTLVSEADWEALMNFLLRLIAYNRPAGDLRSLESVLATAATSPKQRKEISAMIKTATDVWFEEGLSRGREEGREEGVRKTLVRIGRRRLGEPTAAQLHTLNEIRDVERLERMSDAIDEATSWDSLLAIP